MDGGGRRNWRHHRHWNFSRNQRYGSLGRLSCAGFRGLGCRRIGRALRRILLRGTWRGISQSRRRLRISQSWPRSTLGISFWLDGVLSRSARRDGYARCGISSLPRIFIPSRWHAALHLSSRPLGIYVYGGATFGGSGRDCSDSGQLFERTCRRRDSDASDDSKDEHNPGDRRWRRTFRKTFRSGGRSRASCDSFRLGIAQRILDGAGSGDVGLQRLQ